MGRVKSIAVKSIADELLRRHGDRFATDFEKNKKVLGEVCPIKSKKIRNVMAGYITTKIHQKTQTITPPKPREEDAKE